MKYHTFVSWDLQGKTHPDPPNPMISGKDLTNPSKVIDLLVRSERQLNLKRFEVELNQSDSDLLKDLREFLGYPVCGL